MTTSTTKNKYFEAVGRRKRAIARVRLTKAAKTSYHVNGQSLKDYFKLEALIRIATRPLTELPEVQTFEVSVKTLGGGVAAQAEAMSLGLARALVKIDAQSKPALKKLALLSRDDREKERRKFGLKKARKAPQWSKR